MNPPVISQPNLNSRIYREFVPRQAAVNKFLDFVDVCEGNLILGTSNLNGKMWDGSLCYYKNFNSTTKFDAENYDAVLCVEVGVTDGKLLNNGKNLMICQESGDMKYCEVFEDGSTELNGKYKTDAHGDMITEISFWPNTNSYVTSSADGSIKVWEMTKGDPFQCVQSFE